jgi:hypothetical protein
MLVAIAAYRVGFTTRRYDEKRPPGKKVLKERRAQRERGRMGTSAARYDAMEEEISRADRDRDRARVAVVALVVATAASRDGDGASLSSAAAETTRRARSRRRRGGGMTARHRAHDETPVAACMREW